MSPCRFALGGCDRDSEWQLIDIPNGGTATRSTQSEVERPLVQSDATCQPEEHNRPCRIERAPEVQGLNRRSEAAVEAISPELEQVHIALCGNTLGSLRRDLDDAGFDLDSPQLVEDSDTQFARDGNCVFATALPALYNDLGSDDASEFSDVPEVAEPVFEVAGHISLAMERRDDLDTDFEEEVIALYLGADRFEDIDNRVKRLTDTYERRREEISEALSLAQSQLHVRLEACRAVGIDPQHFRYRRGFFDTA